jgi:A/G-specific adenine glycosylase
VPISRRSVTVRSFSRRVQCWFKEHGRAFPWRRDGQSLYRLVVTEILLQRTRAETIAWFFPQFFSRFPSWRALSKAEESELQEFLKPIGIWRRRANVLKRLSLEMVSRRGRFPREYKEIRRLPGVGQYVANAIVMFRDGAPLPLLDTNMARVLERYFGSRKLADIRHDPYLQDLAHRVVGMGNPKWVNWAILDLAAMVCKVRNPVCVECPLSRGCRKNFQ